MDRMNQTKTSFDTTALLKATGGNKLFFNQMLDTFIDNAEGTFKGIADGLERKDWKQIGEKAHKAMPSFKYFELNEIVNEFKTLEDLTLRDPDYSKVPGTVKNLLKDLEVLIADARNAKFSASEI